MGLQLCLEKMRRRGVSIFSNPYALRFTAGRPLEVGTTGEV